MPRSVSSKSISIRGDVYRKFRAACVRHGVSMSSVVEAAVTQWVAAPSRPPAPSTPRPRAASPEPELVTSTIDVVMNPCRHDRCRIEAVHEYHEEV